ncbi:MAG: DUF2752 domain-containing protein [Fusicatenibacter sp.]|nr:DUF2752 domain-containing protein [Fusicatenibacter sp.]
MNPDSSRGRRSFWQRFLDFLRFGGIFLLYVLVITVTGIGCPIRWFTGISCPGCGMSRALLCLLCGNIRGAFSYHPMIFAAIPLILYLFLAPDHTPRQRQCKKISAGIGVGLLLLVYGYRIFQHDPLVTIDPASGVVLQCLQFFR